MEKKNIALKCRVCSNVHDKKPYYLSEFSMHAYEDGVEWSDFHDDVPELKENIWPRSYDIPKVGETRTVKFVTSLKIDADEEFRVMYYKPLTSINGWVDHPEEIEDSAVVTCIISEVIAEDDHSAWAKVRVMDVMMIGDITESFEPQVAKKGFIKDHLIFSDIDCEEFGDYVDLSCSAQGDIGAWALVKKVQGRYHLLFLGDWDFYHDYVYVGNYIIDDEDMKEFLNR